MLFGYFNFSVKCF